MWGQTPNVDTHSGLVWDTAVRLAADMFARFISMQRGVITRSCNTSQRCPERRTRAAKFTTVRRWIELDNKTNVEWNRMVYLHIQEQSELDRKCHKHNLSGWVRRKSVWEQMWDIHLQPILLSGSEGFNYWWHWLICMKHLLSNVTYAHLESCWV